MKGQNDRKLIAIQEYCCRIEKTVARFGDDYNTFIGDSDYYDSVFMKVVQISEIVKTLDDDFKIETKDCIPWDNISGAFSHIREGFLSRNHYSVLSIMDDRLLWNTIIDDIPKLRAYCDSLP